MYRIDECGMHSRAPSTQAFFGKWRQRHTFASFAGVLTVVLGRGLCEKMPLSLGGRRFVAI
jgi:hypothetical protein